MNMNLNLEITLNGITKYFLVEIFRVNAINSKSVLITSEEDQESVIELTVNDITGETSIVRTEGFEDLHEVDELVEMIVETIEGLEEEDPIPFAMCDMANMYLNTPDAIPALGYESESEGEENEIGGLQYPNYDSESDSESEGEPLEIPEGW